MPRFKNLAVAVLALGLASLGFTADENKSVAPSAADAKETEYLRKLDDRVAKIVATLELKDDAQAKRVHSLIVAQYRTLNVWHETNDLHLKELKKAASGSDLEKATIAKTELGAANDSLKNIHNNYLTLLATELVPELIERVKDGMTVGKVKFTYTGYVQEYPTLTEEQKAKVLELLKEAREEAMDAGGMEEKSDIFNRYKGRINNWLSKQGVDQGKGKKPKAEKKESTSK